MLITFIQHLRILENIKKCAIVGLLIIINNLQIDAAQWNMSTTSIMSYLSQYGYLPSSNTMSSGLISKETIHQAISEFQSFAGLEITGSMNNETAHLMSMPRCGVKDKVNTKTHNRVKRYALQGSRWRVHKLFYKISKYPKAMDKLAVDKEIAKAFSVWSAYTDLTFIAKKSGSVHIEIRFERGNHGDGDPFDGPGGTLAHAYFPVFGGDAHFDDSEHWSFNSFRGTNLFQVAAHEFGHSLGLSHSEKISALMAPFYRGYDPNFILDSDDVQGIQALYGSKTEYVSEESTVYQQTTTSATPGEVDPHLCQDSKIDAIFNSAEGQTYVFKGDYYWKLSIDGVEGGYPRVISKSWKGLPGNIDAAFTHKNGKTYFFKGSKYWRFVGKNMDGDYPKDISEGFTGIPDNIDAVTVWTGNGKIYFYKGTKFWKFDPAQKPPVKNTYPKLISNWEGIPDNIDASLSYNGHTYFFKNELYYRFNDKTFSVDTANPAFPRPIGYWWFGCKATNRNSLNHVKWIFENSTDKSLPDKDLSKFDDNVTKYNEKYSIDDVIVDTIT